MVEIDIISNELEEQKEILNQQYSYKCSMIYEEIKTFKKNSDIRDNTILHIAFQEILKHELKKMK